MSGSMKTVSKIWSEYGIFLIVFISDIAKTVHVAWMCYLAWNVETFLLHVSFIYFIIATPPPPLPFSIGVNLSPGYASLNFSPRSDS